MNPTIIKPCAYAPTMLNDHDVWIKHDPDARNAKLYPEYCLVFENNKYLIMMRPWFVSDGGSLPRITWTLTGLTPFDPRCVFGFFIHDGLFQSQLLSQLEADIILNEIMCIEPRPNWAQREITYRTLRTVGHYAYNSKTTFEIELARQFVTVIEKSKLEMKTVIY